MASDLKGQTLGLAGVLQCAILIDRIAQENIYSAELAEPLINSIFVTDPKNIEEVYGGIHNLQMGLEALGKNVQISKNATIYFNYLLMRQKNVQKNETSLNVLSSGIENIRGRFIHFPLMHENIQMAISDLYQQAIQKLPPRFQVTGPYATSEQNTIKIRPLLLAGVRSGIIWSQYGGTTLKRLFFGKNITEEARRLLI